ncbi:hypothetical protein [Paracidovorax wautersii]|uniref:Uncharacterized protein n=1 Tax=Paracidovorax wautersii TaxID=1177982 RepID=A0A1I2G7M6_9BURK|nr:hypothetical protein [Paracidovorax wautersii]SFF13159.1 hypothetical protein SAMN04489711_113148 [Paracidovorax wautersii]
MNKKSNITSQIISAALIAGCGGGGGGDTAENQVKTGFFSVQGTNKSGKLVLACVDGIEYIDPASSKGKSISSILATKYEITDNQYRTEAASGRSCRDQYASITQILSVSDLNRILNSTPNPDPGTGTGGNPTTGSNPDQPSSGGENSERALACARLYREQFNDGQRTMPDIIYITGTNTPSPACQRIDSGWAEFNEKLKTAVAYCANTTDYRGIILDGRDYGHNPPNWGELGRSAVTQLQQDSQSCASSLGNLPTVIEPPPSPTPAPSQNEIISAIKVSEGYEQNRNYNQYQVTLKNNGNTAINCTVFFDYTYVRGLDLVHDRTTTNTGKLSVGAEKKLTLSAAGAESNVGDVSWTSSCDKWPF